MLFMLAVAPVLRIFWLAAGGAAAVFETSASVLAVSSAALLRRGDWISRFLVPGLVLYLLGWQWVLVLIAVSSWCGRWARLLCGVIDAIPRCLVAVVCDPQGVGPHHRWPRRARRVSMVVVLALALASNGVSLWLARTSDVIGIDGKWYLEAGENLLRTGIYSGPHPNVNTLPPVTTRATRMPGYPMYLATCRLVAGPYAVSLASGLQTVAIAFAVLLVFLIGERLFSSGAGLAGGVTYALYLPLSLSAPYLLTESLAVPLYLLSAFVLVAALDLELLWIWALGGSLLGVCTLLRPQTIATPALVGLLALWPVPDGVRTRRRLVRAGVMVVGFVLTMSPWWVRNALVLEAFVPATTLGGYSAWAGNTLKYKGTQRDIHYTRVTELLRERGGDEVAVDRYLMRMALGELSDALRHPGRLCAMFANKARMLILRPHAASRFWDGPHLWLLFAAFLGGLRLRKCMRSAFLAAFVVSVVVLHLLTYAAEARYFLPLIPLLAIWAGVALSALLEVLARDMHVTSLICHEQSQNPGAREASACGTQTRFD